MGIFQGDASLMVISKGPGKLSILCYQSNGKLTNNVGHKSTKNSGETRWMIGFSHTYERFAFCWEGQGTAVYRIGDSLQTFPVGTSWSAASVVKWGASNIVTENVTANITGGINLNTTPILWVIPEKI